MKVIIALLALTTAATAGEIYRPVIPSDKTLGTVEEAVREYATLNKCITLDDVAAKQAQYFPSTTKPVLLEEMKDGSFFVSDPRFGWDVEFTFEDGCLEEVKIEKQD